MVCWHNWKVVEKEVLPSAMEQLQAAGVESVENIRGPMFHKACLVTSRCEKCGAERVLRL